MNNIYLNPDLKPLIANLKRLSIGKFLFTKEFELFALANNFDEQWNNCKNEVLKNKTMFVFGEHNTDDEELAFSLLLNSIYSYSNEHFNYFISIVLSEFVKWHPTKLDMLSIHENLKAFMSKKELLDFTKEIRKIKDSKPNLLSQTNLSEIILPIQDLDPNKVFIVHGHDDKARLELQNILKDDFGLKPIVLQDKPNESIETIISKFERLAKDCSIAIVLFTPDDFAEGKYRARQNVVLELGYFLGKFCNESSRRIIVIKNGEIEIPSDISGVIYLEYFKNMKELFLDLKRQFEAWDYELKK
jgi:predicted nucleotide-binding protein